MKRLMLVLFALAMFGFVFGGCKKDKPAEPAAPPADEVKKDEPPPPPPAEPKEEATEGEPAKEGDVASVGVPECDEYIGKYMGCLKDKVPEAGRAAMEQGLNTMRDAWKKMAETEAGKTALATACKQASEASKKAMSAYGCEW